MRHMTGLALLGAAIWLTGCARGNIVETSPQNTGGGGISAYEGHSARTAGASGTGSSSASRGQGAVPDSGAPGEPGNAQSPSESNGGSGVL